MGVGDEGLGTGSELEWPAGTQAGDGNSGVAQIVSSTEGAIGYVDLSDAIANALTFAKVQNKAGNFIEPTLEATSAAVEGAEINDDLTFFAGCSPHAGFNAIAFMPLPFVFRVQKREARRFFRLSGLREECGC